LALQSDGGGNIHFYEILKELNEIKMLENDKNLRNKISASIVQKSNFVILNMDEKSTNGYVKAIESVVENDKWIVINVK
jgi:hypothetical protein